MKPIASSSRLIDNPSAISATPRPLASGPSRARSPCSYVLCSNRLGPTAAHTIPPPDVHLLAPRESWWPEFSLVEIWKPDRSVFGGVYIELATGRTVFSWRPQSRSCTAPLSVRRGRVGRRMHGTRKPCEKAN